MVGEPTTLLEAIRFFSDPDVCVKYFAEARWPEGPVCQRCEGKDHYYLASRRLLEMQSVRQTVLRQSRHDFLKSHQSVWTSGSRRSGCSRTTRTESVHGNS